jgi:cytochrome c
MTLKAALSLTGILLLVVAGVGSVQAQVDADDAQSLAKKNDCFKCHAIDNAKMAPSYRKIAAKLKAKPDAVERVIKHITTGPKVKLEDGTEEVHKIVSAKDPNEIRSLAQWILAR